MKKQNKKENKNKLLKYAATLLSKKNKVIVYPNGIIIY